MQKIYPTGIGDIALEDGWALIQKPENFRCPQTVLRVANAIRRGGDGLVQVGGRTETVAGGVDRQFVEGSTRIFVLLADERRDERLAEVRRWVAARSDDDLWEPGPESPVKVLVIVHRMAANRLGFSTLYAAMNDKAPEAFKSGFLDATAWPLRPLVSFALPLSQAMGEGREFDAIQLLRAHSPLLAKASLKGKDIAVLLAQLRRDAQRLTTLMREGTVGDVFQHLARSGLMELDVRITSHLEVRGQARALEETEEPEEANREVDAMGALFRCPATELSSYLGYVEDESPFSTQQGVKGAEFSEVLVVLDDDEGTHMQFSYDKYFGVKPPSDADRRNIEAGRETTVDRTRRLFYVCCTRALRDLVVVYFSTDPALAARQVRASEIFPEDMIFTDADLAG